MTNPPFGSTIPITDESILGPFDLAHIWEKTEDGNFRNTGRLQGSVAPEILFIERCLDWLKPGGRMGIVLPDGILGNPAAEYIRWWILRNAWVLASVDLPVETFIVEANVNILTSLLFLKKKPPEVITREALGGTPRTTRSSWLLPRRSASTAVATRCTSARPRARRSRGMSSRLRLSRWAGARWQRTLRRKERIVDDDLGDIAQRYRAFRQEHPEPAT